MLYIVNSLLILLWTISIVKKEKYSWHGISCVYFFSLVIVDTPEVTFNHLLSFYKFPTHLLTNFCKDNQLGIVFSDGIILPLTAIIFCHYVRKKQQYWRMTIIFTFLWHAPLEWIYLKLGYIRYENWNKWYSILIYFAGFLFFGKYANRLLTYNPPLPYFIRIGTFTYGATAWIGAIVGGALAGLYQWRPYIFHDLSADDRFTDLGISWLLAILTAIIIPKVLPEYRPFIFIGLAIAVTVVSFYFHGKEVLIYNHWNHILTALRWLVPFTITIVYDRWETNLFKKSFVAN